MQCQPFSLKYNSWNEWLFLSDKMLCLGAIIQDLVVPMRVREDGREERTAPVLVSVGIEPDTQSASRRQLMCFQVRGGSPVLKISFPLEIEHEFAKWGLFISLRK